MKRILTLFSILFVAICAAQTNLTTSENYIYNKTCLNDDCTKTSESIQYFDSWGKPVQVIGIQSSPTGKDVVGHIEYDAFGRQTKNYLPVPQAGTQNGAVYTSPLANASAVYGSEKIYSESILENSPLSRVQQQIQAGNDWTNKPVTFGYDTNAANEVNQFSTTTTWENGATKTVLTTNGKYAAEKLSKNTVTDEDGNTTAEFKNAKGQVVLIRKLNGATETDTYYVYNEYNQLAFVLPPNAVNKTITDQLLNDLCYQYRYDGWGRQVEKKVPGKGWEYIVYDKGGRPVLTQDANLRTQGKWLFTKYDQFSRPVYTGILDSPPGRIQQTNVIEGAGSNNEIRSTTSWNNSGIDVYYTNSTAYPTTNFKLLSVNYYDTYPTGTPAIPSQVLGQNVLSQDGNASVNTKSLPVASFVKNIEDDSWTKNFIWYDTKGRNIGMYSVNHLGGYTKTESELDFAGLTKQTKVYHKRLSTDTEKIITQTYTYDSQNRLLVHKHKIDNNPEEILVQNVYNEISQVKNKKVGGTNPSSPLQSIDYSYNIRGWLTKVNDPANLNGKLFGYEMKYANPAYTSLSTGKYNGNIAEIDWKTSADDVLRRYNYQYDALNRLKKGVFSQPDASVPQNGFFNETMEYDMNGNITSLQRNGKSYAGMAELIDNLTYNYTGNKLNSVSDASGNYYGYPDTSGNAITYDDNGNMKDQKDKGILQISYNFLNLPDYVKFDQTYNPRFTGLEADFNVNTRYLYRADGTKLRKVYLYGSGKANMETYTITEYLDGFQYEDRVNALGIATPLTLKFVPTAGGYYNFENNKYIYSYKDHLGNVRVSYTNNGSGAEIIEENNYYAFGMKHEGYNQLAGNPAYNYGYNSKELQKETGWSDYGARMYMADLGRWGVVDALSEQMRRYSPYNYAFNNPINFIDPDGNSPRDVYGEHSAFNTDFDPNSSLSSYNGMGGSRANYFAADASSVGNGSGSGMATFGDTKAYQDLMDAYYSGGTAGLSNIGGILRWWTEIDTPEQGLIGSLNMLKLGSSADGIDFSKTTSNTSWWVNVGVGAASTANLPRSGFFKYNELWHQTKTRGISYAWKGKWSNSGAKFWRGQQVKGFQGARSLGTKLTAAGGVLLLADVAMSGEVKPSHWINGAMLGASTTGVGSIVAGVWFVADVGTGAVNYLNGDGFKTLSDVIDQSDWGKGHTAEMYDGLY